MNVVDTSNPSDEYLRAAWLNERQDLELLLVEGMPIPNSDLAIDHLLEVQSLIYLPLLLQMQEMDLYHQVH